MQRWSRLSPALTLALLAVLMAGVVVAGGWGIYRYYFTEPRVEANPTAPPEGVATPPGVGPDTIADTVARIGPAVVYIETARQVEVRNPFDPFFNDPFFGDLFRDHPRAQRRQTGLGSGFIINKDGYILTNEHVVANADEISVTVADIDKPFKARVVGSDYDLDLAVLKIDAGRDLPTLELGNSGTVRVGEWVIAIGNPYGLDHTVTVGVISATGRPITIQGRLYKNLIQTDAAINPGNSGGPLLNLKGQVVGINTAINAQAQGIGFAIPINTVKEVLDELINQGKVVRPWLGVYLQDLTPELAEYFGLNQAGGAVVSYVVSGSPAAKAGLQQGDVILEVNKEKVKSVDDLVERISKFKVGEKAVLLVRRGSGTVYVPVTIGEKPSR